MTAGREFGRPVPNVGPACAGPLAQIGGTYVAIVGSGTSSNGGTTYVPTAGQQYWGAYLYTQASPSPTPAPTVPPTTGPTSSPVPTATPLLVYTYYGTYTVTAVPSPGPTAPAFESTAQTGCFYVEMTADGSPIPNGFTPTDNTVAFGNPNFSVPFDTLNAALVVGGKLTSIAIGNLGPTTGSGTFTLDNGATGTVTLTSRTLGPFALRHRVNQRGVYRR